LKMGVKFGAIFFLLNSLMLFALFLVLIPLIFNFGWDGMAAVRTVWIVLPMLVLLVGVLDFYFIRNWKLLSLLEAEDWLGSLAWLENRLYVRRKLNRTYSSLLINTALSVSNLDAIRRLEVEIRQKKPVLLRTLGVALGIPVLLKQDWKAIAEHYGPLAEDSKTRARHWAIWCRAVALGGERVDQLIELLNGRDISLCLLSWEILERRSRYLSGAQLDVLAASKKKLKGMLNSSEGERMLRKSRKNYLISLLLSSQVDRVKSDLMTN